MCHPQIKQLTWILAVWILSALALRKLKKLVLGRTDLKKDRFQSKYIVSLANLKKNISIRKTHWLAQFSSVHLLSSVVSNSLWPHELKQARPPCASPIPGIYSNSFPLSWWCHSTISSSVLPFFSLLQSFPASEAFQMSHFFSWSGQSIGVSASASVSISPSNWYSGLISFRMDWLDLLAVQGTLKSLLQHHSSKASTLWPSAFLIVQLSHPYMTTGKTIALTRWSFVSKVMSLLFNMLSRLVITFLPRSKCLLISWLQSPSAVILKPQK